jgi:mRNA-degrading endonuclease RelE of RelBE toxin-antitoxin system
MKNPVTMVIPASVEALVRAFEVRARNAIERAMRKLALDPLAGKPLHGALQGAKSVRAGRRIRIIFRFDPANRVVTILDVAQRKDVYRR